MRLGEWRKEAGIEASREALDASYRIMFERAVRKLAAAGKGFTSEDVVALVGLPRRSGPNSNNGVGALMSAMAKTGVIQKTGRWRKAERPESNAREVREWIGTKKVWDVPGMLGVPMLI